MNECDLFEILEEGDRISKILLENKYHYDDRVYLPQVVEKYYKTKKKVLENRKPSRYLYATKILYPVVCMGDTSCIQYGLYEDYKIAEYRAEKYDGVQDDDGSIQHAFVGEGKIIYKIYAEYVYGDKKTYLPYMSTVINQHEKTVKIFHNILPVENIVNIEMESKMEIKKESKKIGTDEERINCESQLIGIIKKLEEVQDDV